MLTLVCGVVAFLLGAIGGLYVRRLDAQKVLAIYQEGLELGLAQGTACAKELVAKINHAPSHQKPQHNQPKHENNK